MAKKEAVMKENDNSIEQFIEQFVENEQKRADSFVLIERMKKISNHKPKMWGPSIIGFGSYHYKYASGHEGDAPLIGFSPRKSAISLYVFCGLEKHLPMVERLGKIKMGKACIYVKKLSDINLDELDKLMKATIDFLDEKYEIRK
ncbi:MAG: DUF1801 domain-containing protein [Moheibacter sp.]